MKYMKILPLLLTAAISVSAAAPVSAMQMPEMQDYSTEKEAQESSDATGTNASVSDQISVDESADTEINNASMKMAAEDVSDGMLEGEAGQDSETTDQDAITSESLTAGEDAPVVYGMMPFTYTVNYTHINQSSIGGVASSEILKKAEDIIVKNEGNYATVVKDDNGALSIGEMQWHANNAAELMKLIVSADNTTAYNILGETLYNEIINLNGNNAWASRILNDQDAKLFSKLLNTDKAKRVQDDLMDSYISVYINHAYNNGLRNAAAVVYSADVENQCGSGGASTCAKESARLIGNISQVTLNEFHIASVCYGYNVNSWSKNDVKNRRSFTTRRINTYVAASGYGWNYCNDGDRRMPSTSPRTNGIGTAWLQNALNRYQQAGLTVDGQYGAGTKTAVTNFQNSVGLKADGDAGTDTIGALINAMYVDCAINGGTNKYPVIPQKDIVYDSKTGKWVYTVDGTPDYTYTGVAHNSNGWWRVEKGIVNFNYNGVAYNENGWWYIRGGQVDFSYTGLAENENGWWYIQNGKVDFTYNGFAGNTNGWWYVDNGQVTFKKNSVLYGKVNGKEGWWHVVNSKVTYDTTVAENSNGWWYVKDGKVDFSYNGFAGNTNGWWYVDNGQVTFKKNSVLYGKVNGKDGWWHVVNSKVTYDTTVAENGNGWWYVKDGKVDFTYNGFSNNTNGWWYVDNGQVTFKKNSVLYGKVNGKEGWWHIRGSQVTYDTTVAENANGWWRIENGKVNFNFTGLATNENGWWYLKGGKVDFFYNGIAKNENGQWYVKDGRIDFTYSGTVTFGQTSYVIKYGKVESQGTMK